MLLSFVSSFMLGKQCLLLLVAAPTCVLYGNRDSKVAAVALIALCAETNDIELKANCIHPLRSMRCSVGDHKNCRYDCDVIH